MHPRRCIKHQPVYSDSARRSCAAKSVARRSYFHVSSALFSIARLSLRRYPYLSRDARDHPVPELITSLRFGNGAATDTGIAVTFFHRAPLRAFRADALAPSRRMSDPADGGRRLVAVAAVDGHALIRRTSVSITCHRLSDGERRERRSL